MKTEEFLTTARGIFAVGVEVSLLQSALGTAKTFFRVQMWETGPNATLSPPSMQPALAFDSEDALQSGRNSCSCRLWADKGVGDFCLDLAIRKAVAHQRKFLNLRFPVSERLPDGIFFSSLHQRRP